jgi:hypothetical protein
VNESSIRSGVIGRNANAKGYQAIVRIGCTAQARYCPSITTRKRRPDSFIKKA